MKEQILTMIQLTKIRVQSASRSLEEQMHMLNPSEEEKHYWIGALTEANLALVNLYTILDLYENPEKAHNLTNSIKVSIEE